MNGKELKVADYKLTYGASARMVYVFGAFRYKKNNNLYVVYADKVSKYTIIYYGSTHLKNNTILVMSDNKDDDMKIVMEFISKTTKKENLDNFEMLSLENISELEIISFGQMEVKQEVMDSLVELTIPKKVDETPVENVKKPKKKKKISPIKFLFTIIILALFGLVGYVGYTLYENNGKVSRKIICERNYQHEELDDVDVSYKKSFSYDSFDNLLSIDYDVLYKFNDEDVYFDFLNRGLYYTKMPEDIKVDGETSQDNENHTFRLTAKEKIGEDYDDVKVYEEVLTHYINEGYSCDEKVEK